MRPRSFVPATVAVAALLPLAAPASAAAGTTVIIQGFAFAPSSAKAKLGATVTWANKDFTGHTAADVLTKSFATSIIGPSGGTASAAATLAGTLTYHCTIHTTMTATLAVAPTVSPVKAKSPAKFTVTWATKPLAAGVTVDVQVKWPGSGAWHSILSNSTATSTVFNATDAGAYQFQVKPHTAAGSQAFSPAAKAVVLP